MHQKSTKGKCEFKRNIKRKIKSGAKKIGKERKVVVVILYVSSQNLGPRLSVEDDVAHWA